MKSQENEPTEDAPRPSHNVFDQLGQNKDEDMRTHLDASHNSATSKRKDNPSSFSPLNDEINKLRERLEKLGTKNIEAAPTATTSPFSVGIQQVPLLAGLRMPTMETYKGKTDPQDYLDAFNDQMNLI